MNQRILAVAVASIAVACGSSGGDDLYQRGAADSGAQGKGGSAAATGGSSGFGGSTGGVGGPSTGGNGGSIGAAGSSGASGTSGASVGGASGTGGSAGAFGGASGSGIGATGGTNSSGGTLGTGGAPGTGGSGGIAPEATVPCGAQPCATSGGSFCCFAVQNGSTSQETCMSPGGTCSLPETQAFCDGPEDCPGGVCCGTFTMFSILQIYSRLECATSCTGANQRIVCDPAHPSSCPSGTCQSYYTLPAGYEICQ